MPRTTRKRSAPTSTPTVSETETPAEAQQPVDQSQPAVTQQQVDQPQPEKKPRAPKPLAGMMVELKKLVWSKPEMSADDLLAELKRLGFSPSKSSVSTIRADFLHSLRVLAFVGVQGLDRFVVKPN